MSKELVISATSHERRVAILEEGQLVEIYIEREKEFALVGSIYKGRVTRVLPGMQSAFVDIGLDGDAFLYVSDVFENLEEYDHGHATTEPQIELSPAQPVTTHLDALPGETLAHAHTADISVHAPEEEVAHHDLEHEAHLDEAHADEAHAGETHDAQVSEDTPEPKPLEHQQLQADVAEERQPDSN